MVPSLLTPELLRPTRCRDYATYQASPNTVFKVGRAGAAHR